MQREEPSNFKERYIFLINKGKTEFPDNNFQHWQQACDKIANAGYGSLITLSYLRESPHISRLVSPESAIELASTVSLLAIKVNRSAAELLPKTAIAAVQQIITVADFRLWLSTIEILANEAPESVFIVLENTEKILRALSARQFSAWVHSGIYLSQHDKKARFNYFSFKNPESDKWFRHAAGDVVFSDLEAELKTYLLSLWKIHLKIRYLPANSAPLSSRRITLSGGIIQVPQVFPGFHKEKAIDIFRAGLAHVGAHIMYSKKLFQLAELKPIQITLISLLEDARVEYLAIQEFPGLKNVWLPFHVAKSSGPKLANNLLARLSRALLDDEYEDNDGWVQKGRNMFFDPSNDLSDPMICRKIGVILGNDLGQMRAQFDAKSYVIEPAYRDDNIGLWDPGDQHESEEGDSITIEAIKKNPDSNNDSASQENKSKQENHQDHAIAKKVNNKQEAEPAKTTRYAEFDYEFGIERPDWAQIIEYPSSVADPYAIESILDTHADLLNKITNLIQSTKTSYPKRLHRQNIGDSLDLDACIDAVISQRMQQSPDAGIYTTMRRQYRDLSVQLLLDISNSTNDIIPKTKKSVLQVEIEASSLLAYAMMKLGDPFAIAAFCSKGKEEVHYYRIKDFDKEYDDSSKARLAGIKGKLSTRIGIAMRHAIHCLSAEKTQRRLLLIITDGEPSDIDVKDKNYLIEDARKAVQIASNLGIDIFCVGLDPTGKNYLHKIFGRNNFIIIDQIQQLPEHLPLLYLRLTG